MTPTLDSHLAEAPRIPGLDVEEIIGRGAYSLVFRARREGRPYGLKVWRPGAFDDPAEAARRFRREAAAIARVRHAGLAAIFEVGEADGKPYLVMEHVEGRTLAVALDRGPLPEPTAVAVGRSLAAALAEVHRRGLVHRDVKPANILLDEAGRTRLVDFGFATRTGSTVEDEYAGTLRYCAPEQSGMRSRPIDGRADLYALGAVLFECATGRPPFEAASAEELLRLHAFSPPPEPRSLRPDLSPALAAIITRLLAKDPDERYASGDSLLYDLERLDAVEAALRRGEEAALGSRDEGAEAAFESPLVGRDGEIGRLEERWSEAERGRGGAVLVEGEPGSGKSRLVAELVESARRGGALVLQGKCAGGQAAPFGPLREAVEGHLRGLRRLARPEREAALDRLRAAAAEAGPLLRRLAPGLAAYLGEAVEPPEAHEQFFDAAASFLLRLGGEAPLLLFLDDVQWLDDGSAQVVRRLAGRLSQGRALLAAAGRNDAASAAGLERIAADVGAALGLRLRLGPLAEEHIGRLVSAHLGGWPVDPDLVDRIAARSEGSPFAAGEYVRALLEAGRLVPSWGRWSADERALDGLDLPRDVLALVERRVADLGERTREVLRAAAVLGVRFRLEHLGPVSGLSTEEVHAAIGEATRSHLVERAAGGEYAFAHDRVREALLAGLEPDQIRDRHRRAAEALDGLGGERAVGVFELARHWALGGRETRPARVYETNRAAGLAAVEAYADGDAFAFLDQASRAAQAAGVAPDPALAKALGDVCARTGRLDQAADFLARAIDATADPVKRAPLRVRLALVHVGSVRRDAMWAELERAFRDLGQALPRPTVRHTLAALWDWARGLAAVRLGLGYGTARGPARERARTLVQAYEVIAIQAYHDNAALLLLQMGLRSLWPASRLGPSRELCRVLGHYGMLMSLFRRRRAAARWGQRAVEIAEALGDRVVRAYTHLTRAWAAHYGGASREAEALARRCLIEQGRWLDVVDYTNACGDLAWNLQMRGYLAEALAWIERGDAKAAHRARGAAVEGDPRLADMAGPIAAALGRAPEGQRYLERARDRLDESPDDFFLATGYFTNLAAFHLEVGELGAPLEEALAACRRLPVHPRTAPMYLRDYFVIEAYARLAQALAAPPDGRAAPLARARQSVRRLRRAANVPVLRCHALVAAGALEALVGRPRASLSRLSAADAAARAADSPWAEFEVARVRAGALAALDHPAAAAREARRALALAIDHGWLARARRVRSELGIEDSGRTSSDLELALSSQRSSRRRSLQLQRQLDALLEVSLAAARVRDPGQQIRVALDTIVRLLGAERAYLFLTREQGLEFAAGRDAQGGELLAPSGYSSTVVDRVVASREPLVVAGTDEGELLGSASAVAHGLRSIVAAPLMLRDRLIGVVYLDTRAARGMFKEDDVDILVALANHVPIALETARAAQLEGHLEAERQRRRLAETMRDLTAALNSTLDLPEVLDRLLAHVMRMVPADRAEVVLVEGEGVRRVAARGGPAGLAEDPLCAEVVRSGQSQAVADLARDPRARGRAGAWLGVPLASRAGLIGVLALESRTPGAYGPAEAELATAFAGQAGVAVENARLFLEVRRLATTDELTGTHNRRQFILLAETEFRRFRRHGRGPAVMMIDLDHFKRVNDTHGHAVGDAVLREVAQRWRMALREVDVMGRLGGEEFAALLPETDLASARDVVGERLRRCVADELIETAAGPVAVTVSVGVAAADDRTAQFAALLQRADAALYLAKQGGRNRVVAD